MKKSFAAIAGGLIATLAFSQPLSARPLTAEDLVSLQKMGAVALAPDEKTVAVEIRTTDAATNSGKTSLYTLNINRPDQALKPLAGFDDANVFSAQYHASGALYFLSDKGGRISLWRSGSDRGGPRKAADLPFVPEGYLLSPDGSRIAIWAKGDPHCQQITCASEAGEKEAAKASGRVYDHLFVRHWDSWGDGQRSRLMVFPLKGGQVDVGGGIVVSRGLPGDVPSSPFGDASEIGWAPDGKSIYFALRRGDDGLEPLSTNLDIYQASADSSLPPVNLTATNKATDTAPAVSPDGRYLAWLAMARPGYEADRLVIHVRDLKTGDVRALSRDWDRSVESIAWTPDSKALLATARDHYDRPVFRVALSDGRVDRLTDEGTAANVLPLRQGFLLTLDSLVAPADLYKSNGKDTPMRLTEVNAERLAGIHLPEAHRFSFQGAGGDMVWGYAMRTPGAVDGGQLPIAYLVHGGPQSTIGNGWSYRWNPAVIAGAGYGVVFVDFHGSVGYGQAFTDSINQDWGGKPLEDLKRGLVAARSQFSWLDTRRACALGGSYGGYMMNWIAGKWPEGFDCLVNHAGVFDLRSMAYETEELWFTEWEMGGPYHRTSAVHEKWSPVHHVGAWKTPMLVIHGEKDFRVPYTQGIAAFTALQRQGIESRLLIFPDENHWILKPANSLQWYDEVLGWLGRYLKSPEEMKEGAGTTR